MNLVVESKANQFYSAIMSLSMSEYLDMVEHFQFGCANLDRTELEEGIPLWDMALELLYMGYRTSDLKNQGYKYTPEYCPL